MPAPMHVIYGEGCVEDTDQAVDAAADAESGTILSHGSTSRLRSKSQILSGLSSDRIASKSALKVPLLAGQ